MFVPKNRGEENDIGTDKMKKYFAEHVNYTSWVHVSVGLGIAWMISRAWSSSTVALILGIIFIVIGTTGHIYPLFAKK